MHRSIFLNCFEVLELLLYKRDKHPSKVYLKKISLKLNISYPLYCGHAMEGRGTENEEFKEAS